jgi:pyruvate,orthophosphate dikinase
MGKCAIVGAKDIHVDLEHKSFSVNGTNVTEGDWLTLDGATGRVFAGDLSTIPSEVVRVTNGTLARSQAPLYQAYAELLSWADEVRVLRVRANADTPRDARIARGFGAEGIGLCRTEHMFFEGDRITAMREMIVAARRVGRRRALNKLLPIRADFEGIFEAMDGRRSPFGCWIRRCMSFCLTVERSRSFLLALSTFREPTSTASSSPSGRPIRCSGTAGAGSG